MFEIGDKVSYPMYGAGVIEAINDQSVMGETKSYYTLHFVLDNVKIMVPVENTMGLRDILPIAHIDDLFQRDFLDTQVDNWNKRYKENLERLRTGDVFSVAHVVDVLTKRDRIKGLSAGEKKLLSKARKILVSELILATNMNESQVNEEIDANIV